MRFAIGLYKICIYTVISGLLGCGNHQVSLGDEDNPIKKISPINLNQIDFRVYIDSKAWGSRLSVLNLKRSEQNLHEQFPKCPKFLSLRDNRQIESNVLPFTFRIPYPVSYGDLQAFNILAMVILDNDAVRQQIPTKILNELLARSINYDNVPIAIALYEKHGDLLGVYNYYTHYWAHDVINMETNKTIDIASGFYDAKGVDTTGLSNAVGLDELTTHGAFVHPIPDRPGLSPNNAQFKLENVDAASFWALSVDVDHNSPHKNSAMLIFNIILRDARLSPRFVRLMGLSYNKVINHDIDPCIKYTGLDFIKEFSEINYINNKDDLINKLKKLMI